MPEFENTLWQIDLDLYMFWHKSPNILWIFRLINLLHRGECMEASNDHYLLSIYNNSLSHARTGWGIVRKHNDNKQLSHECALDMSWL